MHNRRFLLLIFFLTILPRSGISQLTLDIVYPSQEVTLILSDTIAVYGAVTPSDAQVFINGHSVRIHGNGGFLEQVPTPPNYLLDCLAMAKGDSLRVRRSLQVAPRFCSRNGALIDTSFVFPKQDVVLQPGEVLEVAFKGAAGLDAFFLVEGLVDKRRLVEASSRNDFVRLEQAFVLNRRLSTAQPRGIYYGYYQIPADARVQRATVKFGVNGANGQNVVLSAKGTVSIMKKTHHVLELIDDVLAASNSPDSIPQIVLPAGSQLTMTGQKNGQYRATLDDADVWIPADKARALAGGTPLPVAEVSEIRTTTLANKLRIKILLDNKLPYKVEQYTDPSTLSVTLFNAYFSTRTRIRYDSNDKLIREMHQQQPQQNVYQLNIHLNRKQQWGYHLFYVEDGLVIDIRKPPKDFELKSMLICVDPGHAPGDGVLGPHRLKEKDANLRVALRLKQALEKKGATVYLTRMRQHGASTEVRMQMASFLEADLFVSVHHATCADDFIRRGSSTSYFHPQSRALARAVQSRLLDKLHLHDDGFYHHPTAVNQLSQMPAITIKPASITHPEEELLLQLVDYQEKTAEAVVKGIEDFLKQAKKEAD